MNKDYSKKNIINTFGISLPNLIGLFVSYLITILIVYLFNLKDYILLILGLSESFIGLTIGGVLLNKYCSNKDIEKCKHCKNWNCNCKRLIKND